MERDGVIFKAPCEYTSSAFTVPKPDGTARKVIYYSKTINKYIKRMHFPISCIDDLLYKAKSKQLFSLLDVKSG